MRPLRILAWLPLLFAARVASAQSTGLDPEHDLPAWMRGWSALRTAADLPRGVPGAGTAASALLFGEPRIGSFWTAGNPAGLVEGVRDSRSDFWASWSRQQGAYRRPLDPGAASLARVAAQSWKAFSPTFSMLGRGAFDRERLDPGTRADASEPFGSSPFVTTDTSGTGTLRTRAVLEGAAGWQLGRLGLGATAGFEAQDHSTILSGVVRRMRVAAPGLILGATLHLGGIEPGVHGRLRHRSEESRVIERSSPSEVHELTGYREVPAIEVSPEFPYYRRREENASALGVDLAGGRGRLRWVLSAEATRFRERLWRQQINDPAMDEWNANGWSAHAALQRSMGPRWLFTLHAGASGLSGGADLAVDSDGVIFTADESAFNAEAELRRLAAGQGWTAAITLSIAHESRDRRDLSTTLATHVTATTPTLAIELGRHWTERLFLSLCGAVTSYRPTSTFPNPANRGPVYQTYIAPEVDLYASNARPTAFSVLVRYRVSRNATLWATARTDRVAPSDAPLSVFTPHGSRTSTGVAGGVTLR